MTTGVLELSSREVNKMLHAVEKLVLGPAFSLFFIILFHRRGQQGAGEGAGNKRAPGQAVAVPPRTKPLGLLRLLPLRLLHYGPKQLPYQLGRHPILLVQVSAPVD